MIAEVRKAVASEFRPDPVIPPSEWAERHRRLKPGTTPSPGRWSNKYLPWLKEALDAWFDAPWAEGMVIMKPAQVGGSEIGINLVGWASCHMPGPMLYLCSTENQARVFANDRFAHMIESAPILRSRFLAGKHNGETMLIKPGVHGKLIIAGAGSPSQMISNPARVVCIDEEDQLKDFPGMGSARSIAEKRVEEFRTRERTAIMSWAHPTTPDHGVARTYLNESDRRSWTFPCPHCGGDITPNWDLHVRDTIENKDPDSAAFICHHQGCRRVITDQERFLAVWKGSFKPQPGASERPRFVGLHLSRLCHPRVPLRDLAVRYCNCTSESQLRVFYNMDLGLPYVESSIVLTKEIVERRLDPRLVGRQAPSNTRFITLGADVQSSGTVYYVVVAWTETANAVMLEYGKGQGLEVIDALCRTFEASLPGRNAPLTIVAAGIDHGHLTKDVYSFCRVPHGNTLVVPHKHDPSVRRDDPVVQKKVIDPLRPELGYIMRLALCRDHWMDRVLGRFHPDVDSEIGGGIVLPATSSDELVNHLLVNRRVEEQDRHGHVKMRWRKEPKAADDWLQALIHAEVAAVGVGLDQETQVEQQIQPSGPLPEGVVSESRTAGRGARFRYGRRGGRGYRS